MDGSIIDLWYSLRKKGRLLRVVLAVGAIVVAWIRYPKLRTGYAVDLMMAASFVMTLQIITIFLFVQRYFIQGITLTGIKAQGMRVTRERTSAFPSKACHSKRYSSTCRLAWEIRRLSC